LALLGLEGYRYYQLYGDLRRGKGLLTSTLGVLTEESLEISPEDLARARKDLEEARERMKRAALVLDKDPGLSLLTHLPWLGRQLKGVKALAHIGVDATALGLEAITAGFTFDAIKGLEGGPLSERVVPLLRAVKPQMAAMEEGVHRIEEQRQALGQQGLWGPLAQALVEIEAPLAEAREFLDTYWLALRLAPELLGYEGPRRYLILGMDNTEILPGGGFILVFGFLELKEGRITDLSFAPVESIYWPWRRRGGYIEPPRPLKDYLLRDWPMGLGEASWWPDFPTAAREAIRLYREESGDQGPIDGVVGINFLTLERLLEVLGPVPIERYEVTVDSENVTATTLIITHPEALRPWETHRYDFVSYLAEAIIERALTVDPSRWAALLTALQELGEEKNLLFYSPDPEVQEAVAELGFDGRVREWEGDYLMAVDASVRSTKLNLVVKPSIEMTVRLDRYGNAHNTVALTYVNDYFAWARGQDPRLAKLVIGGGSLPLYGDYLQLLVPERSREVQVRKDGRRGSLEASWKEGGKAHLGIYLLLPIGEEKGLSVSYVAPYVVDTTQRPLAYRLLVQKQPGTRSIPLRVRVELPQGYVALRTELNGKELPGTPLEVATDLRVDRELVVIYQPRGGK